MSRSDHIDKDEIFNVNCVGCRVEVCVSSISLLRRNDNNRKHKEKDNGVTRGEANGQLPISFGGLPIVIFYQ